jgi:hypothetical protein
MTTDLYYVCQRATISRPRNSGLPHAILTCSAVMPISILRAMTSSVMWGDHCFCRIVWARANSARWAACRRSASSAFGELLGGCVQSPHARVG